MELLPKISIVIPCYNQGHFIQDALDSIPKDRGTELEVIIINDGSTDQPTIEKLKELQKEYLVLDQVNKGLPSARNAGILKAKGSIILLLDADNKIKSEFIDVCINLFEEHGDLAVLYGNAEYFGDMTGAWIQGPYNLQRLMLTNFIDANAAVRRSVLIDVGLYDPNMRSGWEDWELWLRIAFLGYKFHYVDRVLFYYRITKNQMSKQVYSDKSKPNSIENYLHSKYANQLGLHHVKNYTVARFKKTPVLFLIKLFIAAYFPNLYNRLLIKNKIRNGL